MHLFAFSFKYKKLQFSELQLFASLSAEKQGFEPWIPFDRYTHFPGVPLQPLEHLSKGRKGMNNIYTPKIFSELAVVIAATSVILMPQTSAILAAISGI